MGDIRKNLVLSAKLEDSQLKKQLEILKKELGSAFSVDSGSLNDLKGSIRDIAKEFGSQLKKELEGIRQSRGKNATNQSVGNSGEKTSIDMSSISKMEVKEMTVANLVVQNMSTSGAGSSGEAPKPFSRNGGGGGGGQDDSSGGGSLFGSRLRKMGMLGGAGAIGGAILGGYSGYQSLATTYAERNNRFSRDLSAGQGVEGISREAGRGEVMPKVAGLAGGALAGAGAGALAGGAIGSLGGPIAAAIGAALGGIGGGVYGAAKGYFGLSNGQGELNKEQTQLLSDAEQKARAISPARQQMLAGGGITTDVLNDQMNVGARGYGMSADQTLQTMLQARSVLGNKGASENFDNIMGNQRFLGIDAGTTSSAIETFAGASGQGRGAGGQMQADIIKKGVAAGLDVSKSGKMLQTMDQFVSGAVGMGRLNTDSAGDQVAGFAKGFAGGGDVTDVTLRQAQSYAEMLRNESSSTEGLSGAANIMAMQKIGGESGGFGTGTALALSKLQSNATEDDVLSVLAEGQRTGDVSKTADLSQLTKQIQAAKQQDQTAALIDNITGGNKNLGGFLQTQERGGTMQDVLGRQRAQTGQVTAADMTSAADAIAGAKSGVQGSSEYNLDVAQFSRSTAEAGEGLKTFGQITGQLAAQMTKMLDDLKEAQNKFNAMSDSTGYGAGAAQPGRTSGR